MELSTEEYERRARSNISAAGKAPQENRALIVAAAQVFATLALAAAISDQHDEIEPEKRGPGRPRKEVTNVVD